MKKTIEYLILGSFILTLIAGASLQLLDINKTVQAILFLLAGSLLVIFVNLKVILIIQKYGLDFYLRYGEDKIYLQYRAFGACVAILAALPAGLISYTLAFFVWLFTYILLMFIIPAGVRLLYGDGEGQTGDVISIVLGVLVFIVFLVIDLVRR